MNVFDGQSTVSPRTPAHSSAASAAPVQPLKATAPSPFQAAHSSSNSRVSSPSDQRCVEDPIPQFVQARAVAMVEADREAREIRGDAGGKHPRNPIGDDGRLSC